MTIYAWSYTDANSNANADSECPWQEGMAAKNVNNDARGTMLRVAQFVRDIGGAISAGGTANGLTVTVGSPFTAYANGQIIAFRATATNTGATTLNVNGIGSKAIRRTGASADVALTAGTIVSGGIYVAQYSTAANGGSGAWVLVNPTLASVAFTGSAADISSGTLADARLPTTQTGKTFTSNLTVEANGARVEFSNTGVVGGVASYGTPAGSPVVGLYNENNGSIVLRPNGRLTSTGQFSVATTGAVTFEGGSSAGQLSFPNATVSTNGVAVGTGAGNETYIGSNGVFARNGGTLNLRPNGAGSSTGSASLSTSGTFTVPSVSADTITVSSNTQSIGTIGRSTSNPWSLRWNGSSGLVYVGGVTDGSFVIGSAADMTSAANRWFYVDAATISTTVPLRPAASILPSAGVPILDAAYSSAHSEATIDYWRSFSGGNPTTTVMRMRHGTPSGSTIGSITCTNTLTAYNTTSDYRLKENVEDFDGSGAMIDALRPVTFTWKSDGSAALGFIAHEVQEVFPAAVTHEKDGEEIQQLDNSKLVPILVAELKAVRARLAALEAAA